MSVCLGAALDYLGSMLPWTRARPLSFHQSFRRFPQTPTLDFFLVKPNSHLVCTRFLACLGSPFSSLPMDSAEAEASFILMGLPLFAVLVFPFLLMSLPSRASCAHGPLINV